jgi:hypothetical protein
MFNFSNKSIAKKSILAISLAACINNVSATPISLVNQGFETGSLIGWSTIGDVSAVGETNVTTSNETNYALSPNQTTMAYLNSSGATINEIESFLGISSGSLFAAQSTGFSANIDGDGFPEGGPEISAAPSNFALNDDGLPEGDSPDDESPNNDAENGNFELTNGSAISQSFHANAGDTIDMSWNYVARDYIPFTDPSFSVLIAPDGTVIVDVLASTTGPGLATGSDGISGVFSFAELLTQTGEYTLGFAVTNSGDTALDAALFLDDEAGDCNPSCNDEGSPENPLLPEEDDTPDSFDFSFVVTEPTTPIFIDPIIAIGYDYIVNSGPNIASVILPDLGDGLYEIYGWDGTFLGDAFADIAFDFDALGVDKFRVLGIETSEMLDPTDDTAFVTGLTFVSAGEVDLSQVPVTFDLQVASVPEPGTLPLLGLAFLSLIGLRKRFQHK